MDNKQELKERVLARKKALEARVHELRADANAGTRRELESIREQLRALETTIQGGWEDMTEAVAGKLNTWLEKAAA